MARIPEPSPRPRKAVEIPPCPQAGSGVRSWIIQAALRLARIADAIKEVRK